MLCFIGDQALEFKVQQQNTIGMVSVNSGWVTTFNEKAVVSENRVTSISKKADLKTAALYGCAITSGFGAVNNDAKVGIGESILIYGLGGKGLSIAYASSIVSGYPIIGIDVHEEKLELSKIWNNACVQCK